MYLVIEETTYEYVSNGYIVKSQDESFSNAQKKKEAFMKFVQMGFRNFQFFDDDRENIKIANSLNKELPEVKMKATLIKQKWIPKI